MSYVVAIPSYNRPDEITKKTLTTLKTGGVDKKKIYVFVANKQEEKNIAILWSRILIIKL